MAKSQESGVVVVRERSALPVGSATTNEVRANGSTLRFARQNLEALSDAGEQSDDETTCLSVRASFLSKSINPASIHEVKTSSQNLRSCSLVLETSNAPVAIGHASV
jgi:hypothetical protein